MDVKEVINKYYQSVNAGDWDSWLLLFDENIIVDEQLAGHIEGLDVLKGGVEGIKKGYSKFLMHPLHTIIEGNGGCVIWRCEAANANGVPIDANGANFFKVENGKITYMSNFHDSVPFKPFLEQKL